MDQSTEPKTPDSKIELINTAKRLAGCKTHDELRTLLKKRLGATLQGRKILNAKNFSLQDIQKLRQYLDVS